MTDLAANILADMRSAAHLSPERLAVAVERKYNVKLDPKVIRKLVHERP